MFSLSFIFQANQKAYMVQWTKSITI